MNVRDICHIIEQLSPLSYQESYDNSGLLVGSPDSPVNGILLSIDVTPDVIDDALKQGANLIIAHHPVIFGGIKRLTGSNYTERTVIKAIKNGIAIYCAHTNLDSIWNGVSMQIAKRLELDNLKILSPATDQLVKLTTFVPNKKAEEVRLAMFKAGAGQIGDYDQCSYNIDGKGTFRAASNTNPYVGERGELHIEPEIRIEVIVLKPILSEVIQSMINAHPYEEVAYDIYPLLNSNPRAGLGMVGNLKEPYVELDFLRKVKQIFKADCIRHTALLGKEIKKVAFCGGSGASLLTKAISAKADVFITADMKYHQFFDADGKILVADIGHFESEQFTVEIFYDYLTKKLPNFAIRKSKVKTNPINYL
jgi:dinuclear metal center YbgI/SA1388 family protein